MKNIFLLTIFFFTGVFILSSCQHHHSEGDGHDHNTHEDRHSSEEDHTHAENENSEIHLSSKQIQTMDIQLGNFSHVKINDYVRATGTLGLPPNALTSVSAKASGFIKSSNKYVEGSYVKSGVIMAYIENPEFIQLQREYLEVSADLVFDRQELERQNKLLASNAGIQKNVERLESVINVKTATLKGIEKQLEYLDIDVDKLSTDNITQRIPLYATMSGYITSIKMHNGMYVTPEMELMEIVNENHLHLELDVFEKDIARIKEGQLISYIVPALGDQIYHGEVHIIGKEFNKNNKTVRIHGHLEAERPQFIKDLFVESKIWLNDITVQAVPEKSVIKDGAYSYIYVTDTISSFEKIFDPIRVIEGNTDNGYTAVQLLDPIPSDKKIVVKGAFYVYAQSKAGALTHEH